ncbi:metallophosphoesterase [Cellulomonas sp. URHD0024]|uniref:metallophosphoesterase family protein n=1 Tax=Cellulomonas sp. URHD0024 TaxID=1302620 RepID=UPI00042700BB|nr:metallophosphoesterase [Cellulomonas sp. URHD0024]
MRLVLLADTHIPRRAHDLPAPVWSAVDDADVVVHAGDWVSDEFCAALSGRARRLVGCHGNNDGDALHALLPRVARVELAGVRLGVVHETGQAAGRERRCDAEHRDLDVLVFGHSHIPWDTVTPAGMRLLNPGSPTDRRRQPHATFMTAEVRDSALVDVVLHRLQART